MFSAMFFVLSSLAVTSRYFSPSIRCARSLLVSWSLSCGADRFSGSVFGLTRATCGLCGPVQFRIFRRRSVPGKILGHAVQLDAFPNGLIHVMVESLFHGVQERRAGVFGELEAGPRSVFHIENLDRIVEAACGAHNRHGTIF